MPTTTLTARSLRAIRRSQPHDLAIIGLAVASWLLIGLARVQLFAWWPVALLPLALALVSALSAWWRQSTSERLIIALLCVLGTVLYTPPAEHLPLSGDAAIYPNEGAFITRTGGFHSVHEGLAAVPAAARTLFYVTNEEQYPTGPLQSYQGMVYGGYYVVDETNVTIRTSRMGLSEVWFALLERLVGMRMALYNTGLFATLSLLLLYAIGCRLYARPFALWATLLLAVSYPQVHFGQAPYGEIMGQFWTLAGIYYALRWLDGRTPWLLVAAWGAWVTTWAGRVDALLLLGAAGLLLLYAAYARDRRSLTAVGIGLPCAVALIALSTNSAYVGATFEILIRPRPWFGQALVGLWIALLLGIGIIWRWGQGLIAFAQRLAWLLHLLVFVALAFVILWATVPNGLRTAETTRNYQEIIWYSSQYITPLLYWLVLAGVGWLLWRGYSAKEFWLLATFLSLAAVFFYRYTSANVYPVSLRRLISDVIPLMVLLAGLALTRPWPIPQWSRWRWLIAGVALGWMLLLSWPLLGQHEAAGTLALIEQLHERVPDDSVLLFETQDNDSWVGWLAAPLYSLYGDWALLFDSDTPDPQLLAEAVRGLQATGRPVYLISQSATVPPALVPPGYTATLTDQLVWQSSLIGQTRAPYPPPYWEFAHALNLYALTASTAP